MTPCVCVCVIIILIEIRGSSSELENIIRIRLNKIHVVTFLRKKIRQLLPVPFEKMFHVFADAVALT